MEGYKWPKKDKYDLTYHNELWMFEVLNIYLYHFLDTKFLWGSLFFGAQ